jgi:hypothetical protein
MIHQILIALFIYIKPMKRSPEFFKLSKKSGDVQMLYTKNDHHLFPLIRKQGHTRLTTLWEILRWEQPASEICLSATPTALLCCVHMHFSILIHYIESLHTRWFADRKTRTQQYRNIHVIYMPSKSRFLRFTFTNKKKKIWIPKERLTRQIENVAGSVWLSLFMDGIVKCKLPSTPPRTGLSRIQHFTWTWTIWNFQTSADVFIWRISWNLQCDTYVPFHEKRRMVPK